MKRICVFCGASNGAGAKYLAAATQLGELIAQRGMGVVYGGASVGLMGALADAALGAGGEVIGVIPQGLVDREVAHPGLTELRVVNSMHERKALMEKLSDGFVALPGGFGTLDEFCEILTWAQLGFHSKPTGLLDVDSYYRKFMEFVDHSVSQGFIRQTHRDMIMLAERPGEMLRLFENRWSLAV